MWMTCVMMLVLICKHGVPEKIMSNRDVDFTSKFLN